MSTNRLLEEFTAQVRAKVVSLSHDARTPHLGSSLSCVDIIVALYDSILNVDPKNPEDPNRDRFILSKGHAVTTLYAVLAQKGFFKPELLKEFNQPGSPLPEHPSFWCVPGVEASTGSLGHGLSLGVGLALSARVQKQSFKTYVLLSDGECNEGSVWEAALLAPAHKLSNLCLIVDFNKWQATGRSQEVTALEPLEEKFASFGWGTQRIDGHDFSQILPALQACGQDSEKPLAIIADTIKGKGISFMEDDNNWHYRIPSEGELLEAYKELAV
tara:strand:+ start:79426 stop:80241 length:816 start_codon:yes stop_codon:yes gene_type:complete